MHSLSFNMIIAERILAAVILGSALGLERELTNKYAGLRTNILVCLGSCVFTILSIYAFPAAVIGSHGDPARISAQILTGIGFIGGGTVLRQGTNVVGLTSAATLWIVAAIGMACGTGMIDVAVWATVLSVGVLVLIRYFERDVLVNSAKNTKKIKIVVTCDDEHSEDIHNFIVNSFNYMHEISKKRNENKANSTKIVAIIDVQAKKTIQSLYKSFQNIKGLQAISIQEDNE